MPRTTDADKIGLTIYLESATVEQLDQAARDEQRSRANMVRLLINEAMQARQGAA